MTFERACRMCGCTDMRACAGGCSWVEEDLCSACDENMNDDVIAAGETVEADLAAMDAGPDGFCPAAPIAAPHRILWRDQYVGKCVSCGTEFTT